MRLVLLSFTKITVANDRSKLMTFCIPSFCVLASGSKKANKTKAYENFFQFNCSKLMGIHTNSGCSIPQNC